MMGYHKGVELQAFGNADDSWSEDVVEPQGCGAL